MEFWSRLGPFWCDHWSDDKHDSLHDGVQLAVVGIPAWRKPWNGVRSVWGKSS